MSAEGLFEEYGPTRKQILLLILLLAHLTLFVVSLDQSLFSTSPLYSRTSVARTPLGP